MLFLHFITGKDTMPRLGMTKSGIVMIGKIEKSGGKVEIVTHSRPGAQPQPPRDHRKQLSSSSKKAVHWPISLISYVGYQDITLLKQHSLPLRHSLSASHAFLAPFGTAWAKARMATKINSFQKIKSVVIKVAQMIARESFISYFEHFGLR